MAPGKSNGKTTVSFTPINDTDAAVILFARLLLSADAAYASVEISSKPTANMTCSGSVCTPAAKAVLNVNDLAGMLAGGDDGEVVLYEN